MWNVPLDHECFDDINTVQWLWYYYSDQEDQKEHFENIREMAEYHASFLAPELVNKIVSERIEKQKDGIVGTNDDVAFNESLKEMFGRDPGLAQGTADVSEIVNRVKQYQDDQYIQQSTQTPYNYDHWSKIQLE